MAERRQGDDPFLDAFERVHGRGSSQNDPFMDAYRRVYGDTPADEPIPQRGALSNAARGIAAGLSKTGTSLAEVVGMIPGAGAIGDWARRTEIESRDFYDPQGTAGAVGGFVGRGVGEVATAMLGGGAVAKGVGALARGGTKLAPRAAQLEAALTSASKLKRGAATAAVNLPVDIAQGLKEEEGLILPGRSGSVAEGVLFSGAAGSLGAALDARKAARFQPEEPLRALPPGQYEMGPSTFTSRDIPETDPTRMIPSRTGPDLTPTVQYDGPAGPAIPMGDGGPFPTQSQIRGLLSGTSTETRPVMLPGGQGLPPMQSTRREVVREPNMPMADRSMPLPAIPQPGVQLGPRTPSADDLARGARMDAAIRAGEAENAVMRAAEREMPDRVPYDIDELSKMVRKRLPKSLRSLSDDELEAEHVYRLLLDNQDMELAGILEDPQLIQRLDQGTAGINQMAKLAGKSRQKIKAEALKRAKSFTGEDGEALNAVSRFTEDQLGAIADAGLDPLAVANAFEAQGRMTKRAKDMARIDAEIQRRGLRFESDSFDPSTFGDDLGDAAASSARRGAATGEVLGAVAGGGVGALICAASGFVSAYCLKPQARVGYFQQS
jgi:hypothetical protein